jgi:hypothetical protein
LTLAFRKNGVIYDPNVQYDGNAKCENIRLNNYNQRFRNFKGMMYPKYKEYSEQIEFMEAEGTVNQLLDMAKDNLK